MAIKQAQPSYKTGYARSASESAHPERWKGLLGAWIPELGPTGGTLRDVSGFGRHGVLTNMPVDSSWVLSGDQRNPGYVLDYSGADDEVQIPSFNIVLQGTLFMWVRRDNVAASATRMFGGADPFEVRWEVAGNLNGDMMSVSGVHLEGNQILNNLTWYFLAFTWAITPKELSQIYIDGKLDASSTTVADDDPGGPFTLAIGNRRGSTGSKFPGRIGSVLIYNRLFSPLEIQRTYEDSMGMFRLKPRLAKAPVVATTAGGGVLFQQSQPSYTTGYAKSLGESQDPGLWRGLLGAWVPMMGPTGITLRDLSGRGNDGTLTGMVLADDWIQTGDRRIPGYALDFDDVDDEVLCVGSNAQFGSERNITMTAWFNVTNDHASGGTICGLGAAVNNGSWFMQAITTGRIRIQIDMSGGDLLAMSGTGVYSQNTWNLMSCHWDGGIDGATAIKMWLNGSVIATPTTSAGITVKTATQDFNICSGGTGDIQIAMVLLHGRGLTTNEVQRIYADSLRMFRKKEIVGKGAAAGGGNPPVPVSHHHYNLMRSV